MNPELAHFASRLRAGIAASDGVGILSPGLPGGRDAREPALPGTRFQTFDALALELFALQFQSNDVYRQLCTARGLTPDAVEHWTQIPAVPAALFKEFDLTSLAPAERTAVFHSSGTTASKPSRHFHSAESLKTYEASLAAWFVENVFPDFRSQCDHWRLISLTPPPAQATHSSLVHMFETLRQKFGAAESAFLGDLTATGEWSLDLAAVRNALGVGLNASLANSGTQPSRPWLVMGTAFSFVHLLDYMLEQNLRIQLPPGSRLLETGGYKNRSRVVPKFELHALLSAQFGVVPENIHCEYGMSELSSQAYDSVIRSPESGRRKRLFRFPPWARVQIISPETGCAATGGETGLIRVLDLANVFSVASIQTEDLAVCRGDGFELVGRAPRAEPRGCSLMSA